MALTLAIHRARLHQFVHSMVADGLVDNEFIQLQNMKASCGRDFALRSVTTYLNAVNHLFMQLACQLDKKVVDFYLIIVYARDLFERSNCIGAVRISFACTDIFDGCHAHDKGLCISGLSWAGLEFTSLQTKLETFVET